MMGVAAQTIQKLAGHSSLSITERSMHLSSEETGKALRTVDARAIGNGAVTALQPGAVRKIPGFRIAPAEAHGNRTSAGHF